jgi:hypothetical protein
MTIFLSLVLFNQINLVEMNCIISVAVKVCPHDHVNTHPMFVPSSNILMDGGKGGRAGAKPPLTMLFS